MDFDVPVYPLEQVLSVKKKRTDDAAKVVQEKKRILELEKERLAKAKLAYDAAQNHYNDKISQLRNILDHETTTSKIQQAKAYLEVAHEKLNSEREKLRKQENQVDSAEIALSLAKKAWEAAKKEVEKIEKHREQWLKDAIKELTRLENKDNDELGSLIFLSKRATKTI